MVDGLFFICIFRTLLLKSQHFLTIVIKGHHREHHQQQQYQKDLEITSSTLHWFSLKNFSPYSRPSLDWFKQLHFHYCKSHLDRIEIYSTVRAQDISQDTMIPTSTTMSTKMSVSIASLFLTMLLLLLSTNVLSFTPLSPSVPFVNTLPSSVTQLYVKSLEKGKSSDEHQEEQDSSVILLNELNRLTEEFVAVQCT